MPTFFAWARDHLFFRLRFEKTEADHYCFKKIIVKRFFQYVEAVAGESYVTDHTFFPGFYKAVVRSVPGGNLLIFLHRVYAVDLVDVDYIPLQFTPTDVNILPDGVGGTAIRFCGYHRFFVGLTQSLPDARFACRVHAGGVYKINPFFQSVEDSVNRLFFSDPLNRNAAESQFPYFYSCFSQYYIFHADLLN